MVSLDRIMFKKLSPATLEISYFLVEFFPHGNIIGDENYFRQETIPEKALDPDCFDLHQNFNIRAIEDWINGAAGWLELENAGLSGFCIGRGNH
ncbi:hypothetical protein [Lacisediminimonas profundi]|uniref:hypothetical protein n=1 Tax=Lacisediminimonas profundi TaxID=2603856 RepID=UPI00124AFA42|nr:hypothetical protein [Lacisediminimonas profundi]